MGSVIALARRAAALVLLSLCVSIAVAAATRVENVVTVADANAQTVHVVTTISGVNEPRLEVGVPNWDPGYYVTADFARNISRLVFTDQQGRRLPHAKVHDSIWTLDTRGTSSVKIEFDYAAKQLDLNQSLVTPTYAILNGINFFFYVRNHTLDTPATVTYRLPAGWAVATGLTPTGDPMTFSAENYDVLVDCPTLAGEFDLVTLPLRGVEHRWAVAPKGVMAAADLQKRAADDLKVIDAHTTMFGEIPYKHYLTINVFADRDIGGLEHLNSYLGILRKENAAAANLGGLSGLTSHEFFHAFNVKRLRPAEMWPYRYFERNYTPLLWVSEGVTDYYTDRGMLRAGLINQDFYLQRRAGLLGFVQGVEAAKYISVEEASVETWLGGIAGGGRPFAVDYYSRGDALGLLLDLSIRHDTRGAATLDDVMRSLYANHYKKGRGFTTNDLKATIKQITKKDYQPFFEKYVSGTEPLPYEDVLGYAGLSLGEKKEKIIRLGVSTAEDGKRINAVIPGGAAEAAGVRAGDILVGIGDIKITDAGWAAEFRKTYADRVGQTVPLQILRGDQPLTLNIQVRQVEQTSWELRRLPQMTASQQSILDAWSSGK
ncbi:MAG TPA: PDZ domain-containing protein [Pyrinomonadaceae bacterium]|nr:PDZ domain-containing protein [Pyrinomonadaceae bacterium]